MKYHYEQREPVAVSLTCLCEKLRLDVAYDGGKDEIVFTTVNVNRPGLVLAGFDEYFGENRVQVIGNAEERYLTTMPIEQKNVALERLFSHEIPCVVVSRGLTPDENFLNMAKKYARPVLVSKDNTSNLTNDLVMFLNDVLAPVGNVYGVLLDVYGVGVLLRGGSGIGKSETALELVKRGHRLIADDNVIVKNVRGKVTGTAPERIRFLMEIRGIGIINVRDMFGVESVAEQKSVDLVIELEQWQQDKKYERFGLTDEFEEILDQPVPKIVAPVRPGRNLAVIVEVACINHRLKEMGVDTSKKLREELGI